MSIARIAGRYAKSLLDLAQDGNKLEKVREDMTGFATACKVPDLRLMLKSPIINTDKKRAVMKSLFDGKVDELTMAFFNIILTKGREAHLPEIADTFEAQYKKLKGITSVKLTTATPVGDDVVATIKAKLEASSATDSIVDIETAVDEKLIGGFVIEFGDKLYDASVAHRLELIRKDLVNN